MTATQEIDKNNRDRLRTALAINGGMEYLETFPVEALKTVNHHVGAQFDYLKDLYTNIHTKMYANWAQGGDARPSEDMPNQQGRKDLRENFLSTLCYPNGQHSNGSQHVSRPLFDSNGFVIKYNDDEQSGKNGRIAEVLADFYGKMREVKTFEYGNELTLNLFMTALGKIPGFTETYGTSIDFRRMDQADVEALHKIHATPEDRKTAFQHALDVNRTPTLNNTRDGHGTLNRQVKDIYGLRFLNHFTEDGKECLVTVNGGIVPLDAVFPPGHKHEGETLLNVVEHELKNKTLISDLPPIPDEMLLEQRIKGTEDLRGKSSIDGIKIPEHAAPLLSLDRNILTGLGSQVHLQFKKLVDEVEPGKDIFIASHNPDLKRRLLERVRGDEQKERMVEIACDSLSTIHDKIKAEKEALLEKVPESAHPHFLMSLGGGGSGKSMAKNAMRARCPEGFAEASLDAFRLKSDLYTVISNAGHLADDYELIGPFALALRKWVAAGAAEQKKNLLYDGTGIPFKPDYSKLADEFKKRGYTTEVVAVDIPLPIALDRVEERFKKEQRALLPIVAIGKHIIAPRAFMHAFRDPNVDKISLYDNQGKKGEHYLVAESYTMGNNEAAEIKRKPPAELYNFMRARALNDKDSMFTLSAREGGAHERLNRIKHFTEDNVHNVFHPLQGGMTKTLAIYDVDRFNEFLNKGMLNPSASTREGFDRQPGSASFVIRARQSQNGAAQGAQL